MDAILPRMLGSLGEYPIKLNSVNLEGYGNVPLHYQGLFSGLEQREWISVRQGNEHPLTNKGLWQRTDRFGLWVMSRFFYKPKTISIPAAEPDYLSVPLNYVSILEHISMSKRFSTCLFTRKMEDWENAPLNFICRIEGNKFGIPVREYDKYTFCRLRN